MLKKAFLILAPLFFVLFVAFPAFAQSSIEGQDWWQVRPPSGAAEEPGAVYVKIAPDINLQTPSFIRAVNEKYKFDPPLDMLALREENRGVTIALCHKLGDGYHMGVIRSVEERRQDRAWLNCKAEDQKERYVYVLPGTTIRLRGKHIIPPERKMELADQISACKDVECVQRVATQLGATLGNNAQQPVASPTPTSGNTSPPSSEGALVAELKDCNGSMDCVVVALGNYDVKIEVPTTVTPVDKTVSERGQDNSNLAYWLAVFVLLAVIFLIGFVVSTLRSAGHAARAEANFEKAGELQTDLAQKVATIDKLKKDVASQREATKASDERLRKFAASMQQVTVSMTDCAKRWNIGIPASYKQLELFNLISGHLDEVYSQVATANRAKEAAENRVKGLLQEIVQRGNENNALEATLNERNDAIEKDRRRCAELYGLINQANAELILVDNEKTDLRVPYAELTERFTQVQKTDPDAAQDLRYQIDMCDTRFTELAQDRMKIVDQKAAAQAEFDVLFEKLAGFEFTEAKLYEEAQRDRNDAATELGKAQLMAQYAQARQDRLSVLEADLGERELELEAREASAAIMEAEQTRRQTELDTRDADTFELNLKWREIMSGLLELLGYDPNKMTLEEIIAIDGSKGVVYKARLLLEEARKRLRFLDERVGRLETDLASQREASRLAIAESAELRTQLQEMVEKFARYSVALAHEMTQRKGLRSKLSQVMRAEKTLVRQLAAITAERDTLVETVASLEEQIDELSVPAFPKPSPVPSITSAPPGISIVRRTDTMPYTAAFDGKAAQEAFFNAAEMILKEGGGFVLNTARRVWIMFELTRQRMQFEIAGIFPAGSPGPSNSSTLGLPKTNERLSRAVFCQDDLRWFIDLFEPQPPDMIRPAVAQASGIPR